MSDVSMEVYIEVPCFSGMDGRVLEGVGRCFKATLHESLGALKPLGRNVPPLCISGVFADVGEQRLNNKSKRPTGPIYAGEESRMIPIGFVASTAT